MRSYIPLLRTYGDVYGIARMDLNATVDFVLSMRRRDARMSAGAHRQIRADVARRSTADLHHDARVKRYQLSDVCRPYRGENIRRCDLSELRMINNELRRRQERKPRLSKTGWPVDRFVF